MSTNIAFERQEVIFPVRSLVIRKVPSLEFLSLGTPLGRSPFILSFRTSLDGMSRADSLMQTQRLTQRLLHASPDRVGGLGLVRPGVDHAQAEAGTRR